MTQGQLSKSQQDIKTPEALTCKLESPKQQNVRLRDESRALSRDRTKRQGQSGTLVKHFGVQGCACLCLAMSNTLQPMDCRPPGSSVIFLTRIVEWVTISFSRDLPDSGIKPAILVFPATAGRFFTN